MNNTRLKKVLIFFLIFVLFKNAAFFIYGSFFKESPPPPKQYKVIEDRIRPGEPVYNALIKNDIGHQEAIKATSAFKGVFDLRYVRPGCKYKVFLDEDDNIHKFIFQPSSHNVYIAVATGNRMQAFQQPVYIKKKIYKKVLQLETSVYDAFLTAGENATLAYNYADIFSWDIDFFLFPRKGDKLVILYERYEDDAGSFVKYGDILAAKYLSPRSSYRAYMFTDHRGKQAYYSPDGKPVEKMFMKMPLKIGYLTSRFSWRRFHPILKRYRAHTGVDYASNYGAPILATADGVVTFAGWLGGYGKLVKVRHNNGYTTYYGHASRITVRRGQRVSQGSTIARVGSTGHSTGPHVHYEIRNRNRIVNPESFNTVKGKPIQKGKKPQFLARVNNYNNLISFHDPDAKEEKEPESPALLTRLIAKSFKVLKKVLWV
ncbi:M23 family metallopeptidase [Candidatus Margulisiibacteriota bacterium]